jgi:hypothetical protein
MLFETFVSTVASLSDFGNSATHFARSSAKGTSAVTTTFDPSAVTFVFFQSFNPHPRMEFRRKQGHGIIEHRRGLCCGRGVRECHHELALRSLPHVRGEGRGRCLEQHEEGRGVLVPRNTLGEGFERGDVETGGDVVGLCVGEDRPERPPRLLGDQPREHIRAPVHIEEVPRQKAERPLVHEDDEAERPLTQGGGAPDHATFRPVILLHLEGRQHLGLVVTLPRGHQHQARLVEAGGGTWDEHGHAVDVRERNADERFEHSVLLRGDPVAEGLGRGVVPQLRHLHRHEPERVRRRVRSANGLLGDRGEECCREEQSGHGRAP